MRNRNSSPDMRRYGDEYMTSEHAATPADGWTTLMYVGAQVLKLVVVKPIILVKRAIRYWR